MIRFATSHEVENPDRPLPRTNQSNRSCLYVGRVRHLRYSPVQHYFNYALFMFAIDLDELENVLRFPRLFSSRRFSMIRFRRSDYFGDPTMPLATCIRALVKNRTGIEPSGPVRLLTHLRYFGFGFNPVSFYYCYDKTGETIRAIVAEVSNTPWGERHCYVIPCNANQKVYRFMVPKEFHVSPFLPMSMSYRWVLTEPTSNLSVQIENYDDNGKVFEAKLEMQRRQLTASGLLATLCRFPWMTAQIFTAIYWQALRLWWKKVPFVPHPKHLADDSSSELMKPSQPHSD